MQLHLVEDQISAVKEQIAGLKKKLEEAEKAKDQAKLDGYDVGGSRDQKGSQG